MTATHDGAAVRRVAPRWQSRFEPILVASTVGTLAAGGIAWLVGWHAVADGFWIAGTLVAVVPAVVWVVVALRRGRAGVDLIAVLALVGHAGGGRVPGRCADRGDAGDRAGAGRGRAAAGLP